MLVLDSYLKNERKSLYYLTVQRVPESFYDRYRQTKEISISSFPDPQLHILTEHVQPSLV